MKTRQATILSPLHNYSRANPMVRPKTQLGVKFLIVVCSLFATPAVFGQTFYTWTGGGDGTNLDVAANWGGTAPNTSSADVGVFNGTVPGNLSLNYSRGLNNFPSGPGSSGLSFQLTSNQVGNVSINNLSSSLSNPNLALWNIQIQPGAGQFGLGNNNQRFNIAARPGGAIHTFDNQSTNPGILGNQLHYVSGGGAVYVMQFTGPGDWLVNSWLTTDAGTAIHVDKEGSGTMIWNPTGYNSGSGGINGVIVGGGQLILTAPISKLNPTPITNSATFVVSLPSQSQSLNGTISSSGSLVLSNGTVTLGGANTYTGNTILDGGTLILNRAENAGVSGPLGVGGTISFNGGTLKYSGNNTFDYSSRFSGAAGQQFNIDSAGRNVTYGTPPSSSSTLTKLGSGTLTLSGTSSYSGLTTVSGGRLAFNGGKTGTGDITLANSAFLSVKDTGTPVTPGMLTVGASSLEFNNINSTTTAPLNPTTLSASGAVNFSIIGGAFGVGLSYPLLSWTSGTAPATTLGLVVGAVGNLSTVGNSIKFTATELALIWKGNVSGSWDTTAVQNWTLGGVASSYTDPKHVALDDTATGTTNITLSGVIQPSSVTVFNNNLNYSINSSGGSISGGSGLVKGGNGTLTLSGGANDYTGATKIVGGTVSIGTLANGGVASDIGAAGSDATNLVLDGGTLQYTGAGASIDRLFSIGLFGGTIDSQSPGSLNLNNVGALGLSGSGDRALTLNTTNLSGDTLAAIIGDNGGATAVTKIGSGKWILTGTNTYSGVTTISGGTLQVGAGGTGGSLGTGDVLNNGAVVFNRTGILTVGGISGVGSLTNNGPGTIVLAGNNSFSNSVCINTGTLQFGDGGAESSAFVSFAAPAAPLVNNGTAIFNSTTPISLGVYNIVGTGNVIVRSGANVAFFSDNFYGASFYTGWTLIDAGGVFQPCTDRTTGLFASSITNNGVLRFISQYANVPGSFIVANNVVGTGNVWMDTRTQNAGYAQMNGDNTYTGGTFIGGGGLIIGDGVTAGRGSIAGRVVFTNTTGPFVSLYSQSKQLILNRPGAFDFTNDVVSAVNDGSSVADSGSLVVQVGSPTLTGNQTFPGGATIYGATLQVGNGGSSGANFGTGAVVDYGLLVFNRADSVTIGGTVSGTGNLVQQGPGTLTLTNNNTYTGWTTVSNGVLIVNGTDAASSTLVVGGTLGGKGTLFGPVTTSAGSTLSPGASLGLTGTLTISNNLDIGGNVAIEVMSPSTVFGPGSFDRVVVGGTLVNNGTGTVTVSKLGAPLQAGDKFKLFNKPLQNGAAMIVTGAGATWTNNLANDGSISVLTVSQPALNFINAGGELQFSWDTSFGSYKLQSQTNSINAGISTNWSDYPGGGISPVSVPINPTNATVFFRLSPAP